MMSKEFKIFASRAPDPFCKADSYWKIPICCLNENTILCKKKNNQLEKKIKKEGDREKREGKKEGREKGKDRGKERGRRKCSSLTGSHEVAISGQFLGSGHFFLKYLKLVYIICNPKNPKSEEA